jgi:hypothetical protein
MTTINGLTIAAANTIPTNSTQSDFIGGIQIPAIKTTTSSNMNLQITLQKVTGFSTNDVARIAAALTGDTASLEGADVNLQLTITYSYRQSGSSTTKTDTFTALLVLTATNNYSNSIEVELKSSSA